MDANHPTGPNGCPAALNIEGEHFWCVEPVDHAVPGEYTPARPHRSPDAQAIWTGTKAAHPSVQEVAPTNTHKETK